MLRKYTPKIPLCKITLFKSTDLWDKFQEIDNKQNHWGKLIPNLRTIKVSGCHLSILSKPHVDNLAQFLLSNIITNKNIAEAY